MTVYRVGRKKIKEIEGIEESPGYDAGNRSGQTHVGAGLRSIGERFRKRRSIK